ncbi:hypothetical protein SAMN05216198_2336 [Halopseudomonas litoralis]|uniref:DUF6708 domain-containing protein n=1 Tax=Halopseudomonas litoralis TaxID=797277 RepID=A0A1H1TL49_9GAMM|nr:DUF6708 domain-containing protein [Halopseudomonas litoralis]SDS60950.1 hypothetical protein SAMN05216198_2336 [Halopseudomonas litoralis]
MTQPAAGTSKKGLFSRDDYLAPPHIPTGQPPRDMLNIIWRKNDVFLDIGSYSIGSAVMVIWPLLVLFIWMGWLTGAEVIGDSFYWYGFMCFCGIPILIFLYGLTQPVPPPVRFNRQRREVCVSQKDGSYWIVPWEQVSAVATAVSSIGQHGKTTQGLLVVGFTNPDPDATEENKHFNLGFSCGGGITAMRLWECIRSYMEVGPEAVPRCSFEGEATGRSLLGWLFSLIGDALKSLIKGDFKSALKDLFFTFLLGAPLGFYLQERKLLPPPDLTDPDIVAWSRPLPPEQWARRSIELERAVAEREADLAGGTPGI